MLKSRLRPTSWAISLGLLWIFALLLRFWGLDRFDTLVFDEVYFANFGQNYLTQTPFFDAHPPLGKYLIAVGIKLHGFRPWGYRWMNALIGSFIPLIIAGIAYRLSHRPRFALIAGSFAVLDGLLLVESRYALINIYLLFFGLLLHYCFLSALESRHRWQWLTLAALCIGATASVKWNGLGLVLGLYLLWAVCRALAQLERLPLWPQAVRLSRLSPLVMAGYMGSIALICYGLLWIPHLRQNPDYHFWQLHFEMLAYHQRVGSGPDVHPYCAPWYTWPLMQRSLSYFYQRATSPAARVPIYGPSLPEENTPWIFDVHGMGNPPLWWASTLSILLLFSQLLYWGYRRVRTALNIEAGTKAPSEPAEAKLWVPLYLCINYAANLLPWILVSRCTFIYHYMPAATFSSLAAAWVTDEWLTHPRRTQRILAMTLLSLAIFGFVFWLPIYLGLPLQQADWNLRLRLHPWFSWV